MQTVALNSRAGAQSLLTLGQDARHRELGGMRPACCVPGWNLGMGNWWVSQPTRPGTAAPETEA